MVEQYSFNADSQLRQPSILTNTTEKTKDPFDSQTASKPNNQTMSFFKNTHGIASSLPVFESMYVYPRSLLAIAS